MGCRNHIHRQIEAEDFSDFRRHQAAERGKNVGVITLALFEQFTLINFIVKQMFITVMLTKGIVTEQHCIARHVGHHAVWPVQHGGFNEDELFAVADMQTVTGFYHIEIPFRMMVMPVDRVHAVGSTVNWRVRYPRHQLSQCACVVFFRMVNDDVIKRIQVNFSRQILHKLTAELVVNGINQHGFFFTNQVAVIAAAFQCFIFGAMKITHFPVTLTYPLDVVFNLVFDVLQSACQLFNCLIFIVIYENN
ncbi:hypothetical protein D3C75_537840 [compost metagenome]